MPKIVLGYEVSEILNNQLDKTMIKLSTVYTTELSPTSDYNNADRCLELTIIVYNSNSGSRWVDHN